MHVVDHCSEKVVMLFLDTRSIVPYHTPDQVLANTPFNIYKDNEKPQRL